ncbi:MAG: GrpB family protein [bacterium]|nr:GrpB family protein [bacterium]
MPETIQILPYRTAWPAEFAALARTLRDAFGDLALRIDHIGSTAVPDLDAKDILDVQITVRDLDAAALHAAVDRTNLEWRADIDGDHCPPGLELPARELAKLYATRHAPARATEADPRDVAVHCHIRAEGRFNQRYALLCRDYLRTHRLAADAYAEIKRQLARRFPTDAESYYDVKDPVFDVLMAGAEEWARRVDWRPAQSDG